MFLRLIFDLLLMIILITVVRAIIGFVMRAFVNSLRRAPAAPPPSTGESTVPLTGELKKDPVCGTYTSAATALQRTVRGQTFYFCSPQCRDKFALPH